MFQSEENCTAKATMTPENRLKLPSSFQPEGIQEFSKKDFCDVIPLELFILGEKGDWGLVKTW